MPRSFLVKKTEKEKFRKDDGSTSRPCYTPILKERILKEVDEAKDYSRPLSPVSLPPPSPVSPDTPGPVSPAVVVEPAEVRVTAEPFIPTAVAPYPPLHPLAVRIANGYIHDVLPPTPSYNHYASSDYKSGSDGEGAHSPASTHSLNSSSNRESDTESLDDSRMSREQAAKFQKGVTIGYTYDAFFISDGRSRRKNALGIGIAEPKIKGRYTCNECGKDYATSSNLSRHKQTHRSLDSKLAKRCPHCDKVYVSMPALSMHILTHNLKHQCNICGKAFSRPWLLQGHKRSHSGEKPYGCAHCGKAFADRSNLRAHMQTHSAFKHYKCKRCNKSFALKSYLNKHYESACFKDDQQALEAVRMSEDSEDSMLLTDEELQRESMHYDGRITPEPFDKPREPIRHFDLSRDTLRNFGTEPRIVRPFEEHPHMGFGETR